jgi:hypothetical protein
MQDNYTVGKLYKIDKSKCPSSIILNNFPYSWETLQNFDVPRISPLLYIPQRVPNITLHILGKSLKVLKRGSYPHHRFSTFLVHLHLTDDLTNIDNFQEEESEFRIATCGVGIKPLPKVSRENRG